MSITLEEVKKLAALSRINLSPEEEVSLQAEIGSILGYIDQINKIDLGNTGSDKGVPDQRNVWRNDEEVNVTGALTDRLLANTPSREGNYVKVKKIL